MLANFSVDVLGSVPMATHRKLGAEWFSMELTYLLVTTMIMDEAAIAESLGVGSTGRSPNSPLKSESTPVAQLTGNKASGAANSPADRQQGFRSDP